MSTHLQRAIIHVDMDAFYASVEARDDSSLRGKPVIVGGTGRRGVVAAASYEARAFGVFSAMPVVRARQRCPQGVYVRPRLARYREVSKEIFEIFHEFTPQVEGLSLDEAFLDVSGSLRLLGTIEEIGLQIQNRIMAETGLQASVGMAHNKFLAKLASDFKKPAGFVHIPPGEELRFLDPLPISRLWGIGRKTEPRLRAVGILTIGQLRRCDAQSLRGVLGNRTGHFQKLAAGLDDREVAAMTGERSISHEMTFDVDVRKATELFSELQRLTEAVMRRTRRQHLAARTIHVKIRDHRFRTHTRSRTLRAATSSSQSAFRMAKALLNRWLGEHANTPVRLLGMGVSGLQEPDVDPSPLDVTVDGIAERYGDAAITRGRALRSQQD
ncbi:MAG: DNA polymerase IV [Xanthomonadales bacterium]|nr:DNA polymerase IV [Xanthomonadales bacterium]NNL96086.1 DNA polymerase IV [Xanthomonadales bacterium]